MKAKAYAKINLNLIIKDKREDGLHNLESVFHKIDLFDEIEIEENNLDKCVLTCNIKELEQDNLIYEAYELLKKKYKIKGLNVKLTKRIPMQAGLGGGSSDCATFIKMVNKYFSLQMSEGLFKSIGKSLGSDVIPCYYDYPVIAKGTGNLIIPVNSNLDFYLVLIKPKLNCNTGLMYKKLDEREKRRIPRNTKYIVRALENKDINLLVDNLFNSFEEVVDCQSIKNDLKESGALGTLLSGSGSCVFGIYENKKKALEAFHELKNKYESYLCKSINRKDLVI